jgi:hypothetical protein
MEGIKTISGIDFDVPACESCGCLGNLSCGKDAPPFGGCELNIVGFCKCCENVEDK